MPSPFEKYFETSYKIKTLKAFIFVFLGKFYNYDSYCSMYEDVFEWILEAFDELNAMEDLADDLETIKFQVRIIQNNRCSVVFKFF